MEYYKKLIHPLGYVDSGGLIIEETYNDDDSSYRDLKAVIEQLIEEVETNGLHE